MKSQDVAQYLLENPHFFEEHRDLILQLELPHPHSERAISITERQMLALREKNRYLEKKLGEWLQFGRENDSIGEKMHRLSVAMIAAPTLQTLVNALNTRLRDDFGIPHVALRLWNQEGLPNVRNVQNMQNPEEVSESLRAFVETLVQPYCGTATGFETSSWFGETAGTIRSQALIALRAPQKGGGTLGRTLGLIALGDEDPQRYYSGMGILYLERLGEIASAAFARIL